MPTTFANYTPKYCAMYTVQYCTHCPRLYCTAVHVLYISRVRYWQQVLLLVTVSMQAAERISSIHPIALRPSHTNLSNIDGKAPFVIKREKKERVEKGL